MKSKMLINAAHPEECRVAVVSDGILEELDVQIRTYRATLANIYKAVVTRVEPALQAVFVDYGAERNGFLSVSDVHPSYFPESFQDGRRRPRIEELFKKGDHVIVQVAKEERYAKGASLTTNISLAGRYLVLMPGSDLHGVSRKIEDEHERKKLKEIMRQLRIPENLGFIIRTAGLGRSKSELSRDLNYLLKLWESIEEKITAQDAPSLLHQEQDVVIRTIRDHFTANISEILVDDKAVYKKAKDFFHQVMPRHEKLVKFYQEKRPIFNKYQLEEQVEQIHRTRVNLKSGAHIVIEQTEAVVTIDVNSGSAVRQKSVEDTAFKVNMDAAVEIARQLRLRDLGGIIVIDFIDMFNKKHKQDVERALKSELKKDRAKTKVLRISSLGVLELSRQRLKSSLGTGEYRECPMCVGRGKIRHPEMTALAVFRRIKSLLIKRDVSEVRATVPAPVAEYLLNKMRAQLFEIEDEYDARVIVRTQEFVPDNEVSIEARKAESVVEVAKNGQIDAGVTAPDSTREDDGKSDIERVTSRKSNRRKRKPRRKGSIDANLSVETAIRPNHSPANGDRSKGRSYLPNHGLLDNVNREQRTAEEMLEQTNPGDEEAQDRGRKVSTLRRWFPFL